MRSSGTGANLPRSKPRSLMERIDALAAAIARDGVLSLDARSRGDDESAALDPGDDGAAADELIRGAMYRDVASAVATLPPREQLVIALRYRLPLPSAETLAEVGAALGVSHARAQQIEQTALSRLREQLGSEATECSAGVHREEETA